MKADCAPQSDLYFAECRRRVPVLKTGGSTEKIQFLNWPDREFSRVIHELTLA
jgi:hypothetical protein